MTPIKLVILGANGQVGYELQRSLLPLGEVIALDRIQGDLIQLDKLKQTLLNLKPNVIINAAAYTAVDKAEEEQDLAMLINGKAPGVITDAAKQLDALLIHYSTDYVFDGTKTTPYTGDDIPNLINVYGKTKLAGEKAIKEINCDYLILRTTWAYAARGNNFLKAMLRLAKEREELNIVADQFGTPTWARNIADATAHIIATAQKERKESEFDSGLYHLSASGKATWHSFATAIIEQAKQLTSAGMIKTQIVLPIETENYPLPAQRPKNSLLESSLLTERFGIIVPEWQHAMKLCIDEVLEK